MTLAEKITRAKTDYDDVFDAGYEKGKAEGGGGGGGRNYFTDVFLLKKNTLDYLFNSCSSMTDEELMEAGLTKENTKHSTSATSMFSGCSKITTLPEIDLSNCTALNNFLAGCSSLTSIPVYDTKKAKNFTSTFYTCNSLEEIPAWDVRSATTFASAFTMKNLKRIWLRNIGASISFYNGAGVPMLDNECLLHLARECRNMGKALTLGLRASEKTYFETTYVRVLEDHEITDDMVKEDETMPLLKEKVPFVKCKSTDAGAMTLKTYMAKKGWTVV